MIEGFDQLLRFQLVIDEEERHQRDAEAGGDAVAVSDQVTPVRAGGEVELDLAGVRASLSTGDEIGLLLYGFHPYYLNNSILSLAPVPVTVSGEISLPLASR